MTYKDDYDIDFEIPKSIKREIERDYIQKTYYWSVAIGCLIIGFLLGTSI